MRTARVGLRRMVIGMRPASHNQEYGLTDRVARSAAHRSGCVSANLLRPFVLTETKDERGKGGQASEYLAERVTGRAGGT